MKTYSISQLARAFGLSRSTLLYYDRIGLLRAAKRTAAGYRRYSENDRKYLERICMLRGAGLSLADVERMLSGDSGPSVAILEKRLGELGDEILFLRNQQHSIAAMLKNMTSHKCVTVIDKKMWIKMLEAAGMNEESRKAWHAEFERRASEAHHEFLLSLGIQESEARDIQEWSLGKL
ncbi:MerR family transcriptional regulator [Syntrophotalea acetylenica]|uniref:MerR family transcriptional regulator n=1 Tax=Syntrophotalea acetylenica TaxID=29542 RepID=UPI002A364A4A|nr:MerR family transcriptional regulator [Syntrophotalea acetylenica]MDY0263326.1 MerR family transcriptional regulator [Syntrophotalea acetylenica]